MTTQRTSGRKEIVQLNGVTILVVLVLIADFLIVGFIYRYHMHQLFLQAKIHDIEYTGLLKVQHDLHADIIKLEGVKTWDETEYVRALRLPTAE